MKKLLILITTILLYGCVGITSDKGIYATSLTQEWNVWVAAYTTARVVNVLAITDGPNIKSSDKTRVSADFTLLVDAKPNPETCRKARERANDIIPVEFWFNDDNKHIYTYDNGKVWLTSMSGVRYHLQPTEYKSSKKVSYQTYNQNKLGYNAGRQYFQTPLLCEQLEGAVFELRGLYKDGVEMPPIIFRINHITKKNS